MMIFILDIGGEGRHDKAWNLNPAPFGTLGIGRGKPIPRHIAGRAEAIPLPDHSVDRIIMERVPLRQIALVEIARVIAADGQIVLRHAAPPNFDPHGLARQMLPGEVSQRTMRIGRQVLQETCFQLSGHSDVRRMGRASRRHGLRTARPLRHMPYSSRNEDDLRLPDPR